MLENVVVIVHLVMALGLVGLVLIQQGKGAEAGASFGGGASATVFGAQGTGSFFSRVTAILATVFFATSLGLAFYAKQRSQGADELGLPSIEVQQQMQQAEAGKADKNDVPQLVESASDIPAVADETNGNDVPQVD